MAWLLGPINSTNFLHLKFPIICGKTERGENITSLDSSRLADYLDLKSINLGELSTVLCNETLKPSRPRVLLRKMDPVQRALEYKSLIDNGTVRNQSELAVYLGTSRAWVSKALKALKTYVN